MNRWELPEGWEWTTVGDVIDEGPSNGYSGPVGVEGTPTLRLSATTKGRLILNEDTTKRLEETIPAGSSFFLRGGDLLVQRSNSLDYIGAAAIYDGPERTYIYPDLMMRIRVGTKVDRVYLWQWLNSPVVRQSMRERATGTAGGMPKINGKALVTTSVPLPPPEEQTRIITRLNALQARITTARAGLDELRQLATALKRAVLDAAFRGELTAAWREALPDAEPASALLDRLRAERRRRWQEAHPKKPYIAPEPVDPTELPELPEGWCWARLAELIQRVEAGRSPSSLGRPAEAGEYGVIKVSAMTWEDFDPGENKAMLPGDVPDARDTVKAGDLLISRANTRELVGAVVLVAKDHPHLMLSDKSLRLCYLPEIVPTFLLYALRTRPVRAVFEDDSTGNSLSMLNITQQQILSVPIPLAPLAEQQQLAAFLTAAWSSANHALDAAHALADDLTITEHALLTAAFRGELVPPGTCE